MFSISTEALNIRDVLEPSSPVPNTPASANRLHDLSRGLRIVVRATTTADGPDLSKTAAAAAVSVIVGVLFVQIVGWLVVTAGSRS